ncbi:MAG: hypothetical protein KatS3mg102_2833 [Planctomycetota bacterium]|nr:MAG: hypothetical protein KatS3mg102_2833 [Planctomycetota bacterium]
MRLEMVGGQPQLVARLAAAAGGRRGTHAQRTGGEERLARPVVVARITPVASMKK